MIQHEKIFIGNQILLFRNGWHVSSIWIRFIIPEIQKFANVWFPDFDHSAQGMEIAQIQIVYTGLLYILFTIEIKANNHL